MPSSSPEPLDDLAELRRLINQPEQDELRELRDRLDDKERRAREVAAVLPEALILNRHQKAELTGALQPFVEASVRESIAAALRALFQSFRQTGWFTLAAAGLVIVGLIVGLRSELRWRDFMRRLDATPGIAVTQAEKGWVFPSRVAGLRDPGADDPAALARFAGVNPSGVQFAWKDYLALDDTSVLRRFEKRFGRPPGADLRLTNGALSIRGAVPFEWIGRVRAEGMQAPGVTSITQDNVRLIYDPEFVLEKFRQAFLPPPGVIAKVEDGTLLLAGTAPYEWLEPVRKGAANLPGIRKISEQHLQVAYDSTNVLRRFTDRFNLPDSVNATMEKKVLVLSGEAPHGWLRRVRRGASTVAGIDTIDEHNLIDLDQREFRQSKSFIEGGSAYFPTAKDNFTPEGLTALARLCDEIQRCLTATTRLGLEVQFEVRGYAESLKNEQKDFDLSQRRADAVRDFLVKNGLQLALFRTMGMGAPTPAEGAGPEPALHQVVLKVVPKT